MTDTTDSGTSTYDTYAQLIREIQDKKAVLKRLRNLGQEAATRARKEATGLLDEKLLAIRAAWIPFLEQMAREEEAIRALQEQADEAWRAYERERGSK